MYATYRDQRAQQYRFKLTYFNGRGRCEAIRILLAAGGKDYDDVRLEGNTAWNELKPKTPFGYLPLLEADGKMLNSSVAIARLIAKVVDLAGDNFFEQALVDSVVDTCIDLRECFIGRMKEWLTKMKESGQMSGQSEQQEGENDILAKMKEETKPILKNLEKFLGTDSYFVADKLSFADIQFYAVLEMPLLTCKMTDFLDEFETLKALYNRVADVPKISEYLVSRKSTDF